jgi:type I restriction enzyme M protein
MARARPTRSSNNNSANIGFEQKLWLAADKLRSNMDAAEYKHVVLGLIFLKYISDSFEEHHAKLLAGEGDYAGANPEDPDEYKAENVFWVPPAARWTYLQNSAKQPAIGKIVDDAMVAIERDNLRLKGILPKDYARPALDKNRLGELIDLIGTIGMGDAANRSKDILGPVYEYFLSRFASAEGKKAASSTRHRASCVSSSRCSLPTKVASTTPAAAPAACSCNRKNSSKPMAAGSATSASMARRATPPPAASP